MIVMLVWNGRIVCNVFLLSIEGGGFESELYMGLSN